MERRRPESLSNELELYIRIYYSLLRSSGEVHVRSFEEAHAFCKSSLHPHARRQRVDVTAFGYAAQRLPACMPRVRRLILGQSEEQFESFGYEVSGWSRQRAPERRRPLRWDLKDTLAVFIASASDIDDLIPIITAYQIEWNKLSALLGDRRLDEERAQELGFTPSDREALARALGEEGMEALAQGPMDLRVRLLASSFNQYQRAAARWWRSIEPIFPSADPPPEARPTYFVSSNTHALANLLGGYALAHAEELCAATSIEGPEELCRRLERARDEGSSELPNLLYFALHKKLQRDPERQRAVQRWDSEAGIVTAPDPSHIEVAAQVIEVRRLRRERLDPRLQISGFLHLQKSDAVIVNIDYPLGMAAYQLLAQVCQGVGPLRGIYVMGKAATLNASVGDVLIANTVFDEHSQNTYVFNNAFAAGDLAPDIKSGTVLDNQKLLTVRGTFLQNERYMSVFHKEGYTVMEMEAGPYLSAIHELIDPRRHPRDEVVFFGERVGFPVGFLHYASDTPYSRRRELLSRRLEHRGLESTYACALAITRRILKDEVARCGGP